MKREQQELGYLEHRVKRKLLTTALRQALGLGGALVTLSVSNTVLANGPFGAAVELSSLYDTGINGFVLIGKPREGFNDGFGDRIGEQAGISVSGAGDINADGVDDLIIGADTASPNGKFEAGSSYVVFGGAGVGGTGPILLSSLNGTDGFVLNGTNPNDNSGISVSGAGDINGDGVDDLIIGADTASPNDKFEAGSSYVVFGATGVGRTGVINLSDLSGTDGFALNGAQYDLSGQSVSGAGDINGDGVDDLIIASNENYGGYGGRGIGKSYVVFGGSDVGSTGAIDLSNLSATDGFVLNAGLSVSDAGDINGDGVDDLIIGAKTAIVNGNTYVGASFVVFGGSGVGSTGEINLFELSGAEGFVLNGVGPNDEAGTSVSGAGDVNGDGVDDLIIGAPNTGSSGQGASDAPGESYVVFGGSGVGSTGAINLSSLNGTDGFVLNGAEQGDHSGVSVSGAGDINDDGVDDLIIGAFLADGVSTVPGSNRGESFVVFGGNGVGSTGEINLSSLNGTDGFALNGADAGDNSGTSVSSAGDVNGDGVGDLFIGAPGASKGYVLFGGELTVLEDDIYEVDDSFADASLIENGIPQNGHNINDGGTDLDFATFELTCEAEVVIQTSGATGDDTILSLFDGDQTFLALNDDIDTIGGNLFSRLFGTLQIGTYFVRIEEFGFDDNRAKEIVDYTLSFDRTCTGVPTCNGLPVTVDLNTGESPTPNDDVILGTSDADVIVASGGNDTICGLDGDDVINAGPGNDWVDAGPGNDQVFGLDGADIIQGGDGADEIVSGNGADIINGDRGNDTLNGGPGDDTVSGGGGNDSIFGQGGNDLLFGDAGDDFIVGVAGRDEINGGLGDDTLNGGPGNDTINGDAGNDTVFGLTGNDTLVGGDGNDRVFGQIGIDVVTGGNGDDVLLGNEGDDTLTDASGNNTLNGGPGNDTITGGSGNDNIFGDGNLQQAGDDVINGGAGSDLILGLSGSDTITADDGVADTVNGGPDNDACTTDAADTVFNCP